MGTGPFSGVKRPEHGVDHTRPSKCRGHERVGLYLYSPSGPLWPFIRRTFTFTYEPTLHGYHFSLTVHRRDIQNCTVSEQTGLLFSPADGVGLKVSNKRLFGRRKAEVGCVLYEAPRHKNQDRMEEKLRALQSSAVDNVELSVSNCCSRVGCILCTLNKKVCIELRCATINQSSHYCLLDCIIL